VEHFCFLLFWLGFGLSRVFFVFFVFGLIHAESFTLRAKLQNNKTKHILHVQKNGQFSSLVLF
jgi:hypothetical protein